MLDCWNNLVVLDESDDGGKLPVAYHLSCINSSRPDMVGESGDLNVGHRYYT